MPMKLGKIHDTLNFYLNAQDLDDILKQFNDN